VKKQKHGTKLTKKMPIADMLLKLPLYYSLQLE